MASGFQQETNSNCCDGGVDRISSLPDKAISQILVCLPIKEAVRTSKLSKTWRYTWMSIPELVFDRRTCMDVNFINSVLLLHDGNITKFEVRDLLDPFFLDRWLLLLSRKKLTDLRIGLHYPYSYACLTCLFYCKALSTLKLKFYELQLSPRSQFDGFKNLTVLHLEEVNASKETIEFLVNTSPHLENLSITHGNSDFSYDFKISVISDLKISAPNLRKCVIHGMIKGIITFVKTPELRHTDIEINHRCRLDGIVGGLVKIQEAAFSCPIIQVLPNNFTYLHLNHLRLKINFEDPDQVFAALWLSKSSPSLKIIYIKIGRRPLGVAARNLDVIPKLQEMYDLLGESKDVLQSLETCDLEGFGGSINELRFIQFCLLHASVLQTMKIGWRKDATSRRKRDGALVELAQFQRASLGVKIELYDLK